MCFINADIPLFRYEGWLLADFFQFVFDLCALYTETESDMRK